MIVGYRRVSSESQNLDRQELEGCDKVFEDKASGKDMERPGLDAALAFVREGDTLRCHSADRLSRSLKDMLNIVEQLTSRGVVVEFQKERLIFDPNSVDPFSTAMLSLVGTFSQLERDLIKARQREGIALAKERGAYKGRAAALSPADVRIARQRHRDGVTLSRLVKDYGVARATMTNALAGHGVYASPVYA